jgi:nucleoside-diphosphate-sugar epimerase
MRIAITGASGFLGGYLVRVLRDRGLRVRAVVRRPEAAAALAAEGFETAMADLADAAALAAAFEGCDGVVSNAAQLNRRGASNEAYAAANVDGARRVAESAVRAGVGRFVQISSVAALKARPGHNGPDLPRVGPSDWVVQYIATPAQYGRTKAAGEAAAEAACDAAGVRFTALRPGPIYGRGDEAFFGLYRRWQARRFVALPTASIPHVHAGDVAKAASLCFESTAPGRRYEVTGCNASLVEGMRVLRRLLGTGPVVLPLWTPVGLSFDDGPARVQLGWTTRSLDEGFREAWGPS